MSAVNTPPVTTLWLDETEIRRIGSIGTAAFCAEYQLGNDIQERLRNNGLDQITSLFNLNEEDLKKRGFSIAFIGEIRWALRRMFWEKHPEVRVVTLRETQMNFAGRRGAHGTHGLTQGGVGATGRGPTIHLAQFMGVGGRIGGGIGGAGGNAGVGGTGGTAAEGDAGGNGGEAGGTGNTVERTETDRGRDPAPVPARREIIPEEEMEKMAVVQEGIVSEGMTFHPLLNRVYPLIGGQGPFISTLYLGLFRTFIAHHNQALHESSTFNASIPEETLRNIPMTPLEDLQLDPALLKMLKDDGFKTVGGLLESHPGDLASAAGFDSGYPRIIRAALGEFCARFSV